MNDAVECLLPNDSKNYKETNAKTGIGKPSVLHALIVLFLEYFAWGLIAVPIITTVGETFPGHMFLMNGVIMGMKGLLSFLCAPLIGALSDIRGRKFILMLTVLFTSLPIPLLIFNSWWFFSFMSLSGIFALTYSIVFAYVADVTSEENRSVAFGMVSATFAASFIISPALGVYLQSEYSQDFIVKIATAVALVDMLFIIIAVPESLPTHRRCQRAFSWKAVVPLKFLNFSRVEPSTLLICVLVFLSSLPETGTYSSLFIYIEYVIGFQKEEIAIYIAFIGLCSVIAQLFIGPLMKMLGPKRTIMLGLLCETLGLVWFGFAGSKWMIWCAGVLAAISTITYPSTSAYVSLHTNEIEQGYAQGVVMGVRSLCSGFGPATFGFFFYMFDMDSYFANSDFFPPNTNVSKNCTVTDNIRSQVITGPPFLFGSILAIVALILATYIPEQNVKFGTINRKNRQRSMAKHQRTNCKNK